MTKRISREERLQRAVWQHLALGLPDDVVAYAVHNEGERSPAAGARAKAMGLVPGFPDLGFVIRGQAAFIELKVNKDENGDKTYLRANQRAIRETLEHAKAWYAVCRSIEEVEGVLSAWGVKLKVWSRKAMETAA